MQRNLLILLGVIIVGAVVLVVVLLPNQPDSQLAFMPEQPVAQINILSPTFGEQVTWDHP